MQPFDPRCPPADNIWAGRRARGEGTRFREAEEGVVCIEGAVKSGGATRKTKRRRKGGRKREVKEAEAVQHQRR